MKRVFYLVTVLVIVFGLAGTIHASLVDNGGGLIYDTDLNITWYDYTYTGPQGINGATWGQAMSWAQNLSVTVNGTSITGWRLPTTPGTTTGFTHEGEMGHLYYDELGNHPSEAPVFIGGPFKNVGADFFWTGTESVSDPAAAWTFAFYNGQQGNNIYKDTQYGFYALAVHSGNISAAPVPIPGAAWLLGSGLIGLIGVRRRLKK